METMKDIVGKRFKIVYYDNFQSGSSFPYYQLYIKRIIPSRYGKIIRFFFEKYTPVVKVSSYKLGANSTEEIVNIMFKAWKMKKLRLNKPYKFWNLYGDGKQLK